MQTMTYLEYGSLREREQHHYAKSILFSDCLVGKLPKGRYQTSYLNLHMGMQLFGLKK